MAIIDVNWHPTRKELRVFSALLIVFCAVIGSMTYANSKTTSVVVFITMGGAAVGAIGCLAPNLVRTVYVVWMAAVLPIGVVVSNLLIGFVFFVVVWPIGVVMRWKRGDSMNLLFDRSASTYWVKRSGPTNPRQYFRQY